MQNTIASMMLTTAMTDHRMWMSSLRNYIKDDKILTDMQVASCDDCNFGKWLNSTGIKELGKYHEMAEIVELHKKLHQLGADVVQSKHSGDISATENIISDMQALSKKIVAKIEQLITKIS